MMPDSASLDFSAFDGPERFEALPGRAEAK
jgi:hypothetical protein